MISCERIVIPQFLTPILFVAQFFCIQRLVFDQLGNQVGRSLPWEFFSLSCVSAIIASWVIGIPLIITFEKFGWITRTKIILGGGVMASLIFLIIMKDILVWPYGIGQSVRDEKLKHLWIILMTAPPGLLCGWVYWLLGFSKIFFLDCSNASLSKPSNKESN